MNVIVRRNINYKKISTKILIMEYLGKDSNQIINPFFSIYVKIASEKH
jgi:hypothetical protein